MDKEALRIQNTNIIYAHQIQKAEGLIGKMLFNIADRIGATRLCAFPVEDTGTPGVS